MSRRFMLGLVVCLGTTLPLTPARAGCETQAAVLSPGAGAPVARFKTWLAKQKDAPQDPDLYTADLNNDGKEEFIATTLEGSMGVLRMGIYVPSPDGTFRLLQDAPPQPGGGEPVEGGWYQRAYTDPGTEKPALFTRLCGKTYMSFMSGEGFGTRDSYLWDARGTHPACDASWTAFIRAEFKQTYDRKDYELASKSLSVFATQCARELDGETRAWIDNDLAITYYHLGDTRQCLEYAGRARKSPKVEKAAQHNEELCKKAGDNLPSDFTWLLDKKLTNTNQIVWAKPFPGTLLAIAPDVKQGEPQRLRDSVRSGMTGPGDDKVVDAGRYVTASGCVEHACNVKGMMWVDTQDRVGVVALNEAADMVKVGSCDFAAGSRRVGPKALPAAFWTAFNRWRSRQDAEDDKKNAKACVDFVAPDGTVSRVTPP